MAWTLKRLLISGFVVAHLGAVTVWIVPTCPIKQRLVPYLVYYILPLGQWQYWGMFAPDPMRDTITLEAVVLDGRGLLHTFSFPREMDMSRWEAMWHYRHAKLTASFSGEDFKAHREFAARYVIRRLKLPAEAFPVEVQFFYMVKPAPPPGGPPADPMEPAKPLQVAAFRFPTLQEALP